MTRIVSENLETGSGNWDYSVVPVVQSDIVAHGEYALELASSYTQVRWYFSSLSEAYVRFYFRTEQETSEISIAHFLESGTQIMNLRRDSVTKKFKYYRRNSLTDVGVMDIEIDTWYRIDIYVKFHSTNGRFVLKINDSIDIDYIGDTTALGMSAPTEFGLTHNSGWIGSEYFDDIAVNDTNGSVDNSWVEGIANLGILLPDGDGTVDNVEHDEGDTSPFYTHINEGV